MGFVSCVFAQACVGTGHLPAPKRWKTLPGPEEQPGKDAGAGPKPRWDRVSGEDTGKDTGGGHWSWHPRLQGRTLTTARPSFTASMPRTAPLGAKGFATDPCPLPAPRPGPAHAGGGPARCPPGAGGVGAMAGLMAGLMAGPVAVARRWVQKVAAVAAALPGAGGPGRAPGAGPAAEPVPEAAAPATAALYVHVSGDTGGLWTCGAARGVTGLHTWGHTWVLALAHVGRGTSGLAQVEHECGSLGLAHTRLHAGPRGLHTWGEPSLVHVMS